VAKVQIRLKAPKRDGDHGVPCWFWHGKLCRGEGDTIMKKIALIFALAFALTTGMAVVRQAMADSAPVLYPEQVSACDDGTSC
jgi:hypothetical protein